MEQTSFGHDVLSREKLIDEFNKDPKAFQQIARENQIDVDVALNEISPVDDDRDERAFGNEPEDALDHILKANGYRIANTVNTGTISVEKMEETKAGEVLIDAVCIRDYDRAIGIDKLRPMLQRDVNTDAAVTGENTVNSPNVTLNRVIRNPYSPKIGIADIAGAVETINATKFEIPEYTTTFDAETSSDEGEIGALGIDVVTFRTERGSTKRYGGGLQWSDDFELQEYNVSYLREWVARRAMNDEIRMVNDGLAAAVDNYGSTADVTLGTTPTTTQLLDLLMFDGDINQPYNGFSLDVLITTKQTARAILLGFLEQTNNIGVFTGSTGSVAPSLFGGIELINRALSGSVRLGYVRNSPTGHGITNALSLGIDMMRALRFVRVPRGSKDEVERKAANGVNTRYISRRAGWAVADPDGCFRVATA